MKKMSIMMTMVLCVVISATALAAVEVSPDVDSFVLEWANTYEGEFGWVLEDDFDGAALPSEGDIQQIDALKIAVNAICRIEKIDVSALNGYRPFMTYNTDKVWMISVLPETTKDNPPRAYMIEVDGANGELLKYTPGDAVQDPANMTNKPKG